MKTTNSQPRYGKGDSNPRQLTSKVSSLTAGVFPYKEIGVRVELTRVVLQTTRHPLSIPI